MIVGYFPNWEEGFVKEYLLDLEKKENRRKAAAKLQFDIEMLVTEWPRPRFVRVKKLEGRESLWELMREYNGIAYRVFFCTVQNQIMALACHREEK